MIEWKDRAVIFDLDGVILDSMPGHAAAWVKALSERGMTVDPEFIYQNEGSLEWADLTPGPAGPNGGRKEFAGILGRQQEIYRSDYAADTSIYPGARRLVERLSREGAGLALVTSSARAVLTPEVTELLSLYFKVVVTGDQVGKSKPAPDPYLKALHELGLGPDRALVVENAPAGIESARAAGIFCAALTTTLPESELKRADAVFRNHDELSRWLMSDLCA